MGNKFCKLINRFSGKEAIRIVMIASNVKSKTTVLYKLKGRTLAFPTNGASQEKVTCINTEWDKNSQEKNTQFWKNYSKKTQALILIVSSVDRQHISEIRQELMTILKKKNFKNAALLVFANEQNLPKAMSTDEVTEKLVLKWVSSHEWYIDGTSTINCEETQNGADWLANYLD